MKQKTVQVQKMAPSPTLQTVEMVEEALKNMPNSVMTVAELKRALPRQVNHNTLLVVLEYLDRNGKICIGVRGVTWVENNDSRMKKAFAQSREI